MRIPGNVCTVTKIEVDKRVTWKLIITSTLNQADRVAEITAALAGDNHFNPTKYASKLGESGFYIREQAGLRYPDQRTSIKLAVDLWATPLSCECPLDLVPVLEALTQRQVFKRACEPLVVGIQVNLL